MKIILNTINDLLKSIYSIIVSLFYPVLDVLSDVISILNDTLGINLKKILKITVRRINNTITHSLIIYYFILLCFEIYLLIKVLLGKIQFYSFETLLAYSIVLILYNCIFVVFLNKNYKSKNFSYIIYFQILFLLPLGIVHWIANIEGHTLYLNNLNSDQWISIFNTIIIYFSGCLIGIVTLYKNNSQKNAQK